jgi:hypothetical protein
MGGGASVPVNTETEDLEEGSSDEIVGNETPSGRGLRRFRTAAMAARLANSGRLGIENDEIEELEEEPKELTPRDTRFDIKLSLRDVPALRRIVWMTPHLSAIIPKEHDVNFEELELRDRVMREYQLKRRANVVDKSAENVPSKDLSPATETELAKSTPSVKSNDEMSVHKTDVNSSVEQKDGQRMVNAEGDATNNVGGTGDFSNGEPKKLVAKEEDAISVEITDTKEELENDDTSPEEGKEASHTDDSAGSKDAGDQSVVPVAEPSSAVLDVVSPVSESSVTEEDAVSSDPKAVKEVENFESAESKRGGEGESSLEAKEPEPTTSRETDSEVKGEEANSKGGPGPELHADAEDAKRVKEDPLQTQSGGRFKLVYGDAYSLQVRFLEKLAYPPEKNGTFASSSLHSSLDNVAVGAKESSSSGFNGGDAAESVIHVLDLSYNRLGTLKQLQVEGKSDTIGGPELLDQTTSKIAWADVSSSSPVQQRQQRQQRRSSLKHVEHQQTPLSQRSSSQIKRRGSKSPRRNSVESLTPRRRGSVRTEVQRPSGIIVTAQPTATPKLDWLRWIICLNVSGNYLENLQGLERLPVLKVLVAEVRIRACVTLL